MLQRCIACCFQMGRQSMTIASLKQMKPSNNQTKSWNVCSVCLNRATVIGLQNLTYRASNFHHIPMNCVSVKTLYFSSAQASKGRVDLGRWIVIYIKKTAGMKSCICLLDLSFRKITSFCHRSWAEPNWLLCKK